MSRLNEFLLLRILMISAQIRYAFSTFCRIVLGLACLDGIFVATGMGQTDQSGLRSPGVG